VHSLFNTAAFFFVVRQANRIFSRIPTGQIPMHREHTHDALRSRTHHLSVQGGRIALALVLFLAMMSTRDTVAQDYTAHKCISYPGALSLWDFRTAAGITLTILPRPIVEEELRQVPMIAGEARFGLPLNLSLSARAATNVLTTTAGVGALWTLNIRRLAIAIGDEQAFWYGFATVDGFDLDAQGWLNYPSVSVGFAFDEFVVSLKTEAQLVTYQKTVAGSTEVQTKKNTLSGVAFTIAVEQPFWSGQYVKLGAKVNYSRQLYHAWLAFGTFNEFLTYPEFFVELVF
jgi:hypothetical protein